MLFVVVVVLTFGGGDKARAGCEVCDGCGFAKFGGDVTATFGGGESAREGVMLLFGLLKFVVVFV